MDLEVAFLEQLFESGASGLTSVAIQRLGSLGNVTFEGLPVVIYYLKTGGWHFEEVMKAFDDHNVDWNVRDEDGNTCLHLVIGRCGQRSTWLTRSVVVMMTKSGADPMLKNNSNQSTIESAIADVIPDAVIEAMVRAVSIKVLNEMHILNLIISSAEPDLPITLCYLIGSQEIAITCNHLIDFLNLKPFSNLFDSVNLMIERLAATEDSLVELKRRRPQLLIDVAKILAFSQKFYEKHITRLSGLCKLDISNWSDEHGSVLYHLIAGHRSWENYNDNFGYVVKLLSMEDLNQTYKGIPLIFCYFKSSPKVDLNILKIFARRSTNWNVLDDCDRCPLLHVINKGTVVDGTVGDAISVLLSSGASLEFANRQGNNMLHIAMSTNVELIQMLLLGIANPKKLINARNGDGRSCLGLVVTQLRENWPVMAQYLVNCGADISEIDNDGNNLLHLALAQSNRDADTIKTVIETLRKLGMDIEAVINQANSSKCVPFYNAIINQVYNHELIPNEDILNSNKYWDGMPVIEFVLEMRSEAIKRSKNTNLTNLIHELLLRGANRCSSSTLTRLIALDGSTPELIELAIALFDCRTSAEELDLAMALGRIGFIPILLENANREMVLSLNSLIPNAINKVLRSAIKSPLRTDLHLLETIKILIEKFGVDINFASTEDGFIIHNLVSFDKSAKQEVLSYVLRLDDLDVDKEHNGLTGLHFALSNHNYEAAAQLTEHFADFIHLQSVFISKRGFLRFAKLLTLIGKPSLEIEFDSSISASFEVLQYQNWVSEKKRTVLSLSEMCALAARRRTKTKQALLNLIKDIEFPETTKDVLFLRKEF